MQGRSYRQFQTQADFLAGNGIGRYGSVGLADVTVKRPVSWHLSRRSIRSLLWSGTRPAGSTSTRMPASSRLTQPRSRFTARCRSAMPICFVTTAAAYTRDPRCAWPVPLASGRSPVVSGDVYRGDFGRLRIGGQGSYTDRSVFAGIGGGPNTNEGIFMAALRYYPFAP